MRGSERGGDGVGLDRGDRGAEIRIRVEGAGGVDDQGRLFEETDWLSCGYEKEGHIKWNSREKEHYGYNAT